MKTEENTKFRIIPAVIGLGAYTTIRLINDTVDGLRFWTRPIHTTILEVVAFIGVSYILVSFIHYLENIFFNKKKVYTIKKLLQEILWVMLVCLLTLNLTLIPIAASTDNGLSTSDIVHINIIPTLFYILYYSVRRGHYFIRQYVDSLVRIQKIENDHLISSLEALKAQYDSHFLFNSLNNIYFLMDDNVPLAKVTLEKLSDLLRYHLYQDQEKMVPLANDCAFLKTFIALNKVRKTKSLTVDEELMDSKVLVYPHLFVPLIENAFKYVGGAFPRIEISIKEDSGIVYCNVVNSKRSHKNQSSEKGIGLKNLRKRLELLYQHGFRLTTYDNKDHFKASLVINTL